jgi:hypothetical protein
MKLYLSQQDQLELKNTLKEVTDALGDETLSLEDRQELENHKASLSGALLSPILPTGKVRMFIMFSCFVLGISAFYTDYEFLVWFLLIGCSFSPRLVGEVAMLVGRFQR